MTDLIERAKAALELYDSHPELAEQCLPFMPDLARALIREREAAAQLTKRLVALRTYFDLSEEELDALTRDERADCIRQHRLIGETLSTYRKVTKETNNDK
jgi:hypothetical protein